MKVVVFNVGSALSSYVELGKKKIIVDIGKGNNFSVVTDFLLPLFARRGELRRNGKYYLDQVIVSHPHADHSSDLGELYKYFDIGLFTTPNDLSDEFEKAKNVNWDLVDDSESDEIKTIREIYRGRSLPLRECDLSAMTIGYLDPGKVENVTLLKNESYTNNIGIVLYISYGYSVFFAADLQKEGMKKMLSLNLKLRDKLEKGVDFLVCPHHGLRSSFSTELFSVMKGGKTRRLNIVPEKISGDDNRKIDSRYSSTDFCNGDNNLSSFGKTVCQRKTSQGHIFIDDNGSVTVENDIGNILNKFVSFSGDIRIRP